MARMRALGGDRLLFLTADKGYHALDDVCRKQPGWSVHGSFSLYVNYHALSEWVQHHGGQAVHSVCREPSLSVNAFLFGVKDPIETQLAFDFNLGRGGSPDLFLMKSALESRFGTLSLEQTLAIVRLWAWDSAVFLGCLVELRQRLASTILTAGLRADLLYTLDKVREHHFPIGETPDLETEIAHLIQEIEKLAQ